MKVDVGVVGAGPAGLLAANALVGAGVACAVFERLPEEDLDLAPGLLLGPGVDGPT